MALDRRAAAGAARLADAGAAGQPVVLALPSGLEFIEAIFACWYAGAIAVPISLPRHQRAQNRCDHILADAGAHLAIGSADARQRLAGASLQWIDLEATGAGQPAAIAATNNGIAVLQYTSGSTGSPRGVMVTHTNLLHNCAHITEATGLKPGETIGSWLPLFHDMGLVGKILETLHSGVHLVFMSPDRFLMRPELWLKMISDYRICSSVAPNFAYELCVDRISDAAKSSLDLSSWRTALNGSESIRPATLDRFAEAFGRCGFRREAFLPCYGLAEATLLVTAPRGDRRIIRRTPAGELLSDEQPGGHVGCGTAFGDTNVAIVDPQTLRHVAPGTVGEIWIHGSTCAAGYWNNPDATAATFRACLSPDQNDTRTWLRTGDLGFFRDKHLFITGRLRDLIKIAGRNHFPSDLEQSAEAADPHIAPTGVAAFSAIDDGLERLIVVAELRRPVARGADVAISEQDIESLRSRIRAAIAREHDVTPHDIVLLMPGALPRTTSGKVSRRAAYDAYVSRTLERIGVLSDGVVVA
jgi:acyl-CoA synthetase (AMP-forming)/AMP-acid ligase II